MNINTRTLWAILALLIIAAGVLFYMQSRSSASTELVADARFSYGAYPYMCDNETGFVMEPSQDTQLLRLTSTEGGTFDQAIVSDTGATEGGARYEGDGVTFLATGETVRIRTNGSEITCTPVPNADEAPFNFGD